jgi:hypothetical protein
VPPGGCASVDAGWTPFAERQIKGIGTLEVLAAGGLILLAAFHIASVLTALAVPASTSGRGSEPSRGSDAGSWLLLRGAVPSGAGRSS